LFDRQQPTKIADVQGKTWISNVTQT
jgi:hypothetical protein